MHLTPMRLRFDTVMMIGVAVIAIGIWLGDVFVTRMRRYRSQGCQSPVRHALKSLGSRYTWTCGRCRPR